MAGRTSRQRCALLPLLLLATLATSAGGQERPSSAIDSYAVATLAPAGVTVPLIVLQESMLHALLVELATGASRATIGRRLGVGADELDRLYSLMEVEGLGRQTSEGGWKPLALALDSGGAARLTETADSLSSAIADTLLAHWTELDSLVAGLPVTGLQPLEQTGFVLLGGYLLGLFQAEAFWQAGLAPAGRPYAFRVYRLDPEESPAGHRIDDLGSAGWRIDRFAPSAEPFGFHAFSTATDPVIARLIDPENRTSAEQFSNEVAEAYRLWYLMDIPPDPPTVRLLHYIEAVDEEGRLRVPLISHDDLEPLRSIAHKIGLPLWPILQKALPSIAVMAAELGYDDPGMLGELALWTWERAAQMAVWDLVRDGLLLPPANRRGQALLVPRFP